VIQILWHHDWALDIISLLSRGAKQWQSLFPAFEVETDSLVSDLSEFFQQRLSSLLEEKGFDPDIVRAIAGRSISARAVIQAIRECHDRAHLLQSLRTSGKLVAIQAAVQRASRLADKGDLGRDVLAADHVVDPALFERQSEVELLKAIQRLSQPALSQDRQKYELLAQGLEESSQLLAAFFDGPDSVMVMCEDEERQRNRLNLLSILRNQASLLAHFEELEG
jgi:glycyl-tRNA synthetase beta chain